MNVVSKQIELTEEQKRVLVWLNLKQISSSSTDDIGALWKKALKKYEDKYKMSVFWVINR